jgi:tRNA modification GTPase
MTGSPGLPDTIVAIASPPGRGAVGIVRISGPRTVAIAQAMLGALPPSRLATLTKIRDADGTVLDLALALFFPEPKSFTGETVLELQGHGGPVVLDRVLARVIALGARPARPGEFTERAFLNGKMDLAQAEAVADLIDAGTAAAARAAMRSLQGDFSVRIRWLLAQLTDLRVHVEAAIDFPEEDLDLGNSSAFEQRLKGLFAAFDSITAAARLGTLLREGYTVVIAGKPNAGKSSLINRLVGDEVAIVTELPGTTRDVLRHSVNLDGLQIHFSDTAGLRLATDIAEEEGIRRAKVEIQRADHLLYVTDATRDPSERQDPIHIAEQLSLPQGIPVTWVTNKIDLTAMAPIKEEHDGQWHIHLSAQSGSGVDLLRSHLKSAAGYGDAEGGALSARRRHLDALARAAAAVRRAAATLRDTRAVELFAEELRLAQNALGEITGELSSDDLLGEIFGSFCIGK